MKPILITVLILFFSCNTKGNENKLKEKETNANHVSLDVQKLDTATFAGGCFWCVEASFEIIEGVASVVSGYAGGREATASYNKVSSGITQHAEAVQILYDPMTVDYDKLLDIFFVAHDPTQINRQGPDVGAQYRSAIFYHNEDQKQAVKKKIEQIGQSYSKPIATEINAYSKFHEAEAYHQDFEQKHPNHPYILNVSKPKIDRVKKTFKDLLKTSH